MTLDEKLEQFYKAAIESATNQNNQIVDEYKQSIKKMYEDYKEELTNRSEANLQLEYKNLICEKNHTLSDENIRIKKLLNEKSDELSNQILEEVIKKINGFMKTKDYYYLLIQQIKDEIMFAAGESLIIYLNSSDKGIKNLLEAETGILLETSTNDFIGGTRAVIPAQNILIDYSFSTKLAEEKNKLIL